MSIEKGTQLSCGTRSFSSLEAELLKGITAYGLQTTVQANQRMHSVKAQIQWYPFDLGGQKLNNPFASDEGELPI